MTEYGKNGRNVAHCQFLAGFTDSAGQSSANRPDYRRKGNSVGQQASPSGRIVPAQGGVVSALAAASARIVAGLVRVVRCHGKTNE